METVYRHRGPGGDTGGGGSGPITYQEGLIGALAEGGVVGAVHRRLAGELGVKLTHVFG